MKQTYTIKLSPSKIAIADLHEKWDGDVWHISRINVPVKFRGNGHGRALLQAICLDADVDGVILELVPYSSCHEFQGLDEFELMQWYERYGFRHDRIGMMIRPPAEIGDTE